MMMIEMDKKLKLAVEALKKVAEGNLEYYEIYEIVDEAIKKLSE